MTELMSLFAVVGIGTTVTALMGTLYWLAEKYDLKKEEKLRQIAHQEAKHVLMLWIERREKNETN